MSSSPRRREMLAWANWSINLASSSINESIRMGEQPEDYVKRLAAAKSKALDKIPHEDFVIAADTIVVLGELILGKPNNEAHAFQILSELRGKPHKVITAVAVRQGGQDEPIIDICRTEVKMREYSDEEINRYIESGDPMDKAGAYAIQNHCFQPAVNFCGCLASVMGLPLCHLERTLRQFSHYQKTNWPQICKDNLKYNCEISERVLAGENIG